MEAKLLLRARSAFSISNTAICSLFSSLERSLLRFELDLLLLLRDFLLFAAASLRWRSSSRLRASSRRRRSSAICCCISLSICAFSELYCFLFACSVLCTLRCCFCSFDTNFLRSACLLSSLACSCLPWSSSAPFSALACEISLRLFCICSCLRCTNSPCMRWYSAYCRT